MRGRLASVALCCVLPWSVAAAEPPAAERGVLELLEAVRLTLAHDPNIRLQEANIDLLRGIVVEQSGAFDLGLTGDLSHQFGQQALTEDTRQSEQDRRDQLQSDIDDLASQGDALEGLLDEINLLSQDPTGSELSDQALQSQVDLINLQIELSEDPGQQAQLVQLRDDTIEQQRVLVAGDLATVRQEESDTRQQLTDLGAVPTGENNYLGNYDLALEKPLRSGIKLSTFADFGVDGTNFIGKPKDTNFGGKGITDFYDAAVGFRVDLPLGEGKGRVSAAAGERAAQIDYEASLASLRHTAAVRVLVTVRAYWSLIAAQQRQRVFEESVSLHGRLIEVVQALIDAGEVARVERARAEAREISARGQLDAARADLHAARLALVQAAGLEARSLEQLPTAREEFPETLDLTPIAELPDAQWLRGAVTRRQDLVAARRLEESGKVLHEAARVDLRPLVDLQLEVSASSIEETSDVDEALVGLAGGRWVTPSGKVTVSVDIPFANNADRGRREQTAAALELRQISLRDLERTIRSDVLLALSNVRFAADELQQSSAAVARYREVIAAELEKLRLGTSTVIDAILTEQRLTDALLVELAARQRLWQLLAELRFATGTLVEYSADGASRVGERSLLTCPLLDEEEAS